MGLIVIIIVLVLIFGGGGGYYAHRTWGAPGLGGVVGLILIVLLVLWLMGRTLDFVAPASLICDVGLDSQFDSVLPALKRFDLRATFFLTKVNVEARLSDRRAVGMRSATTPSIIPAGSGRAGGARPSFDRPVAPTGCSSPHWRRRPPCGPPRRPPQLWRQRHC